MPIDRLLVFVGVAACALFGIAWGLARKTRLIQSPFLFAVGLGVIVCPQMYVAVAKWWLIPDRAYFAYGLMVILSTVAFYLGYMRDPAVLAHEGKVGVGRIDTVRLTRLGVVTSAIGSYAYVRLLSFGVVEAWEGPAVIWATMGKLALPGLSLLVLAYLCGPSRVRAVLVVLATTAPLLVVLLLGRRSMALMLPISFMVPLALVRRLRLPRALVIVGLTGLFVVVYGFPAWRSDFRGMAHLESVRNRPFDEVLADAFSGDTGRHIEVLDAMVVVGAYSETGRYRFVLPTIWNSLVKLYVPARLVGRAVKDSLIWGDLDESWIASVYGIPVAYYTSKGAFVELFQELSYLGACVFWYVGRVFRRLWRLAVFNKDWRAILFYVLFGSFPAALPYGAFFYWIATQVPQVVLLVLALRYTRTGGQHGDRGLGERLPLWRRRIGGNEKYNGSPADL